MKGLILAYADNKGVISGHDGNRYEFVRMDWSGNLEPIIGTEIDFAIDGNQAKSVFPLASPAGRHSKVTLAIVCWFFGLLGVHRFMVGKTGTGVVMLLLTITIIGMIVTAIWVLIDFVMILMGNFTDKDGNKITGERI